MTVNVHIPVHEELVECYRCGIRSDADRTVRSEINGEYYCMDCYEEEFAICDRCDSEVYADDLYEVNDEWWCESCTNRHAERCDACHELVPVDETHTDRGNTVLCSSCYHHRYCTCNGCEYFYPIEDCYEDSGFYYCEECWEDREGSDDDEEGVIYAWNDGPPTRFFSSNSGDAGYYYGVEIEVEREASPITRGEMAKQVIDVGRGHVYCKEDGSLKCGFEVVSHAADYEYHLTMLPWKEILDCLREAGYRSHDPGTCGLHVHVSREAFGSDHETQLDRIHRLLYIVEKFWPYWLKLSRRTETTMQHWAARYLGEDEPLDSVPKEALLDRAVYGSKYHAVNLQKPKTVEIRMFRGTLKLSTLRATLQLVHYLVGLATNDDIDLEKITWDDITADLVKISEELKSYLIERKLIE